VLREIDAVYFDFAFEVLQSGNLAVAATVLPIRADLFRVRARSDRTARRNQGNGHGDLATVALSTFLRGWLRSGEVSKLCVPLRLSAFAWTSLTPRRKGAKIHAKVKTALKKFSNEATTKIPSRTRRFRGGSYSVELSFSSRQASAAKR